MSLSARRFRKARGCDVVKPVISETVDPTQFLAHAGLGRRIVHLKAKGVFFSQGGSADSIFFLQKGRARLTVVSQAGKEATITLLVAGDFIGEESVAGVLGRRLSTATAISDCTALKIERKEMILAMDQEHELRISSWHSCWREVCGCRPTSWINSSTIARSGWHGYCYLWPNSVNPGNRKL